MKRSRRVLVIDDQETARTFLGRFLEEVGYEAVLADSVGAAVDALRAGPFAMAITDLRMPGQDGLQGLRALHDIDPDLPIVMLTAFATVETAVQAMKLGAFDYVKKPFEPDEMEIVVGRAIEHRHLVEENRALRAEVAHRSRLEDIVGQSRPMQRLFDLCRKVSPADVPLLITGESGTGKDLVARAVHSLSRRAAGPFLSINCAAVPESLLESELFGHEKGSFSGADRARAGYFREADGGTLFLDEIGDMSLAAQSKLLRVLESGELIPVGADAPVQVDVRVVAATHQDLDALVTQKKFRQDLVFRIETVRLHLPPLRERREDIPLLVATFLERASARSGITAPRMGAAAMRALLQYEWPGNVRELQRVIEQAVLLADGEEIRPDDLSDRVRAAMVKDGETKATLAGTYRDARRAFEKAYFEDLLERAEGNVSRAADLAGLHRGTLYEKLAALEIEVGKE